MPREPVRTLSDVTKTLEHLEALLDQWPPGSQTSTYWRLQSMRVDLIQEAAYLRGTSTSRTRAALCGEPPIPISMAAQVVLDGLEVLP